MNSIANVVIEVSLDKEFDYSIPKKLQSLIKIGSQVYVPFHGRELRGFVVGLKKESSYVKELKQIKEVIGDRPFIPNNIIKLAYWIADYYCAPIENAVKAVLPSVIRKKGIAHRKKLLATLVSHEKKGLSEIQKKIVDLLKKDQEMLISEIKDKIKCSDSPIRTLQKKNILKLEYKEIRRDPFISSNLIPTKPFALMEEQKNALDSICKQIDKKTSSAVLLNGVTGSGKTEVYLQAIKYSLQRSQGAIVLVPEIALTPQTVQRFKARFGEIVAVLHSNLSDGERHDEWHRIHNKSATIVVGARSALFAPIDNVGLIIVDEEHEPTYKQEESPRYHARDVAVMRGKIENCCVVLGSATPSLETCFNVQEGRYYNTELSQRVDNRKMPHIRIINMALEAEKIGHPTLFSRELVDGIYERISKKEQVILFLNRRGFSSSLMCEKCGYVSECTECSITKSYHKSDNKLVCHICGSEEDFPSRCPNCGNPNYKYGGSGTEKIEEILEKLFPNFRIARMDSDSMRRKDSYQKILDAFRLGKTDILIGTQMIAKGLDFPNVTLVGVLNADISIHVPDFRAGERTYQLLTQVAGRAGRGDIPGEVIIQTYNPKHPAIKAASKLDEDIYSINDLIFRKKMMYPPYSHLILVTLKGPNESIVVKCIESFYNELVHVLPSSVKVVRPLPAAITKVKGVYRYQIMLCDEQTVKMTKPIKYLLDNVRFPKEIKVIVDVDALSLS